MQATILAILLVLFLLRVLGQLIVILVHPRWLPPMKDWYSGLIPYPLLLPIQIGILVLMSAMTLGVWRQQGVFFEKHPNAGLAILIFSLVYALSMAIRFIIRTKRHPQARWFEEGTIPILFHFVLAGFLLVFARWQLG